ncbi:YceI family protein [Corynebacterium sp. ES2794-CONJ1]|uniref:YceI family protein n=1 Tax=unclassified Corynebacterium TaxID=2624378 RepID=UPI00216AEE56|nr:MULTISPECIES: YceI family protein [unclassified Corynebacterium]MCS4530943.1 YceI family protein [Corynebacterium sp. ES2730-CONJ]MCU9518310.1 YceI family protein [Corynebacterium sp. ES2794-CONJ1]
MNLKARIAIFVTVTAVVLLGLFALASAVIPVLLGPGIKTGSIDTAATKPATTDIDGYWTVVYGRSPHISSVGFTFGELLPSDRRTTSGSTRGVRGDIKIAGGTIQSGRIEVDMTSISSDRERRDINVRRKIFDTDIYPTANFRLTQPVDISSLPSNGAAGVVNITGELTIKDTTQEITSEFLAVRDGDRISMSSTIDINRIDYGVKTPDFVAAKIDEEGELNILLTFEKIKPEPEDSAS